MINQMYEVEERFEKIKDHKPKASKKLNELGEILASAYRLDPRRADQMWQYIVDLNISDNIGNAKFYIAQVFNKISDRLSPKEATDYITMTPDRVRLMVLHGYDGGTLWRCMDTLIRGYLKGDAVDDAVVCVGYFYEKFGGINSGNPDIALAARKAAGICAEMIHNDMHNEKAKELLNGLGNSESEDINAFIELIKVINGIDADADYDHLFYVAKVYKCPVEFFDLLWAAKDEYELDEIKEKWVDYLEDCDEGDVRPYNYIHEEVEQYEGSKLQFYVDLEKNTDQLLTYYFDRPNIFDVEIGDMWSWIEEDDWDRFTKYVSMTVMATNDDMFQWSAIKRGLESFMNACFYDDSRDETTYGRSYRGLMKPRSSSFGAALSKISAITMGCDCHESYHAFVKDFLQKLNGNLDALNEFGFDEEVEARAPEERLKEYVHEFLQSGRRVHEGRPTKYALIVDALGEELYTNRNGNNHTITIDITGTLLKAPGLPDDKEQEEKEEDAVNEKEEIDESVEQAYRLAMDDEIAKFYFQNCPGEYDRRKDMLAACIKKNNINRAVELIDMMADTKSNEGYDDLNGWGRQNMLTIMYLIRLFDYTNEDSWETEGITDEMRQVAKQLVYRMLPHLPSRSQEELKKDLYRINPDIDDSEDYIKQLLEDADVYTTYPKPRGKGGAPNINRMSDEFIHCFERLSKMGRLDIVSEIMLKFAAVRDVLKPVTYELWVSFMAHDLKDGDLTKVFRNSPEIFEEWLQVDSLRDSDIKSVAQSLGEHCSREEFMTFRNMVISHKGMVSGLDAAYKATSENTETQLLFYGKNAKIELDYLEIGSGSTIYSLVLHMLTTKKTRVIDSVRVLSCKINGIETDNIGSFSYFDDDGPSSGYRVYDLNSEDTLTVYSDFFEENNIQQIDCIDLQLILMDDDGHGIESMSPIRIEYDIYTGEYKVKKVAKSEIM